jgi:predicted AAA+ superfamily ATPase
MKIWHNTGDTRALWLFGAPETGKTYLALQFAKESFEGFIYLNFADDAALREDVSAFFAGGSKDLTGFIADRLGLPFEPGRNFAFILDETDVLDSKLTLLEETLKAEQKAPVIVISRNKPVSAEHFFMVSLFPMLYDEFLTAIGKDWYEEVIRGHFQNFKKVPSLIHEELLSLFEEYLLTGGMPRAVEEYVKGEEHKEFIPSIHRKILGTIKDNFPGGKDNTKTCQMFDLAPFMLLNENRQFRFNQIRKGLTYKDFEEPLSNLTKPNILYKIKNLKDKENSFVLYFQDHGLLNTLINSLTPVRQKIDPVKLQEINPLGDILLKNYFAMCTASLGKDIYYWHSDSSAKVDFIEKEPGSNRFIPYEVDLNRNNRSRSMTVFCQKFEAEEAVFLNSNNFSAENRDKLSIINIPYYALHCL